MFKYMLDQIWANQQSHDHACIQNSGVFFRINGLWNAIVDQLNESIQQSYVAIIVKNSR